MVGIFDISRWPVIVKLPTAFHSTVPGMESTKGTGKETEREIHPMQSGERTTPWRSTRTMDQKKQR
jgi:hypothetical protein